MIRCSKEHCAAIEKIERAYNEKAAQALKIHADGIITWEELGRILCKLNAYEVQEITTLYASTVEG